MKSYFEHVSGPDFKPAPTWDVIEFVRVAIPDDATIIVEERALSAREVMDFRTRLARRYA